MKKFREAEAAEPPPPDPTNAQNYERLCKLIHEASSALHFQREPDAGEFLEAMALAFGDEQAVQNLAVRLQKRAKRATYQDPDLQKFNLQPFCRPPRFRLYDDTHIRVANEELQIELQQFERLLNCAPAGAYRAVTRVVQCKSAPFKAPGPTQAAQKAVTLQHFQSMGGDVGGVATIPELEFRAVSGEPHFVQGPLTAEELHEALNRTHCGRAPGVDGIPADALKVPALFDYILDILQQCFNSKQAPPQFHVIKQVPIPKKGDLSVLANWRPICLLNAITKVYNRILLNRLSAGCEPFLRHTQSGFRRFRSVEEQQASLVQIISSYGRLKPENYALIVNFLDFAKAFPSTSWVAIRGALAAFKVPQELIDAIMSLYKSGDLRAFVQTADYRTDDFLIETGTLQGDTLAPYLFILVLDRVLDAAFAKLQQDHPSKTFGIILKRAAGTSSRRIPAQTLTDVDFADDIALFTAKPTVQEAVEDAQLMLRAVAEIAKRANLLLKPGEKKTAIMVFAAALTSFRADPSSIRITMIEADGEKTVPVVEKYKHLGRTVDHSEHIGNAVISERISSAWFAVNKFRDIWQHEHVPRRTKERLLQTFVIPCLAFSSGSWCATRKQLNRLNTAYTNMRRVVFQLDRYQPAEEGEPIRCTPLREIYHNFCSHSEHAYADFASTTVLRNGLRMLGHALREHKTNDGPSGVKLPDPPLNTLLSWEPIGFGKRQRGGRRLSLADHLYRMLPIEEQRELLFQNNMQQQKRITARGVRQADLKALADDREAWRSIVQRAARNEQERFLLSANSPLAGD
jgi:hypothetical protein